MHVGVKFLGPDCHCAPSRFASDEGEIRTGSVITVKITLIAALEHGKCRREVAGKQLWFGQKNQVWGKLVNKTQQIEPVPVPAFNIPAKDTKDYSVRVF